MEIFTVLKISKNEREKSLDFAWTSKQAKIAKITQNNDQVNFNPMHLGK